MTGAPAPVRLRLRWAPIGAAPGGLQAGQSIRVRIEATDELGRALDVTGAELWVRRPSNVVVKHNGSAVVRQELGIYHVDLLWDAAGTWVMEAGCTGPRAARSPALALRVEASRVLPARLPAPLLLDEAGDPIVLQDGQFWQARRIPDLPPLPEGARAGLVVVDLDSEGSAYAPLDTLIESSPAVAALLARVAALEASAPVLRPLTFRAVPLAFAGRPLVTSR